MPLTAVKLAISTWGVLILPGAVILRLLGWPASPAAALPACAAWSVTALAAGFVLMLVDRRWVLVDRSSGSSPSSAPACSSAAGSRSRWTSGSRQRSSGSSPASPASRPSCGSAAGTTSGMPSSTSRGCGRSRTSTRRAPPRPARPPPAGHRPPPGLRLPALARDGRGDRLDQRPRRDGHVPLLADRPDPVRRRRPSTTRGARCSAAAPLASPHASATSAPSRSRSASATSARSPTRATSPSSCSGR